VEPGAGVLERALHSDSMRILTLSDQGFRKNPTTDSDVIRPLIPGLSDQKYSMVGMLVGLSERRSAP
jgi:hypothetical protein